LTDRRKEFLDLLRPLYGSLIESMVKSNIDESVVIKPLINIELLRIEHARMPTMAFISIDYNEYQEVFKDLFSEKRAELQKDNEGGV